MKRAALLSCLLLIAVPVSTEATEPARAGEYVHEVFQTPHPYPSSGADEPVLTWVDEVIFPGATYISLHFAHLDLADGDFLVVRSPDGSQKWVYERQGRNGLGAADGGFYATHIRGPHAVVELHTAGHASAFGYLIDYYGRGYDRYEIEMMWAQGIGEKANIPYPPEDPESLCGADDTREAKCYESTEVDAYETSRAVARLLLNGSSWCTGWLIGNAGHAMTNEHCISSQSQLNSIDFEFMAEGATCQTNCNFPLACPGVIEASGGTFITDNDSLDYALMIPDTSTANGTDLPATYGFMKLRQTGAVLNERIYHPQHPAGWGKRIGVESSYPADVAMGGYCYASSVSENPCSGGPGDVGYWTDTQGGSSGSPVLGYSDNKIVSLHHCRGTAFCNSGNPAQDDRNRGVPVPAIIAALGDNIPPGALCDAFDGPATLTATSSVDNRVDLSWDAVVGADITYRVHRAVGDCPQSEYETIATDLVATGFADTTVSGGTTYAYTVTAYAGTEGCESDASPCGDAAATGLCIWPPEFDGIESADNLASADCGIALGWSDGALHCGADIRYNVYRATFSGFQPGPGNLVASCVTETTWTDDSVISGEEYFYVVRAEDDSGNGQGACSGGNEESNTVELSAVPTGPDELFFADDMEVMGSEKWVNDGTGGTPWQRVTTSSHSPTHSQFCADEGFVKDRRLVTATSVDFAGAPTGRLQFWHRFDMESSWDGGVLEYSVNEGATWFDILASNGGSIPANAGRIVQGGYTMTLSSGSNPIGGRQAWSGASGGWEQVVVDLGDFAGQSVRFRWRLGCDGSVSDVGWWVDDVKVFQGSDCGSPAIFVDGFESGTTAEWSVTVP